MKDERIFVEYLGHLLTASMFVVFYFQRNDELTAKYTTPDDIGEHFRVNLENNK